MVLNCVLIVDLAYWKGNKLQVLKNTVCFWRSQHLPTAQTALWWSIHSVQLSTRIIPVGLCQLWYSQV